MYSYGPPHMAGQKQDNQLKHTYSSYVRIWDVTLKTCRGRWTIGRSGERGSVISMLAARHDDITSIYGLFFMVAHSLSLSLFLSLALSLSLSFACMFMMLYLSLFHLFFFFFFLHSYFLSHFHRFCINATTLSLLTVLCMSSLSLSFSSFCVYTC